MDTIDSFILKESLRSFREGVIEIELPTSLMDMDLDNSALPLTLNALCLIGENEDGIFYSFTDSLSDSATCMLGRFSLYDEKIGSLYEELSKWEQDNVKSAQICEFDYTPSYDQADITSRKLSRASVLPYLSVRNCVDSSRVIDVQDVYVGIYEGNIIFYDNKHNRQIIPVLSHSQNYNKEILPIYKFIGDVQMHNTASKRNFARDNKYLLDIFGFQPRIKYKNFIFSLAKWIIPCVDIRSFFNLDLDKRILGIKEYCVYRKIPMSFAIVSGDMKLFLNFDNAPVKSAILLEKSIHNKSYILVEENFYSNYEPVFMDDNENRYAVEYQIPFKNNGANFHILSNKDLSCIREGLSNKDKCIFRPGDEWLYIKVYCESLICDKIISKDLLLIDEEAFKEGLIDKWFFLRYKDMQGHQIRIRYHIPHFSSDKLSKLRIIIKRYLCKYSDLEIHTVKEDTYTRELVRYGIHNYENVEDVFYLDSIMHANALTYYKNDNNLRLVFGLYLLKQYLEMESKDVNWAIGFISKRLSAMKDEFAGGKRQRIFFNQLFHDKVKFVEESFENMKRKERLQSYFERIKEMLLQNPFETETLSLFIHMSLNRLYISRNRLNEYSCYEFMNRYYKKVLFSKKKVL